MRVKAVFGGKRIGRGSDISADQAACQRVFDTLERDYGKGIFTQRNEGSVDVALQEDGNSIIITIETGLPVEKLEAFRKAVPIEMNRAGFKPLPNDNETYFKITPDFIGCIYCRGLHFEHDDYQSEYICQKCGWVFNERPM